MENKKFVASYSGGKDSILAIYKAIKLGMLPVSLIITYNTDLNRSWFHGIPEPILAQVSQSLGIPIHLIKTSGSEYAGNFEKMLALKKESGAEVCVFGDIDVEEHLEWCTNRCKKVGMEAFFPLWKRDRRELVYEFIKSGFHANITVVDTSRLSAGLLGAELSVETAETISREGADICGENGEYHTFVSDGPLFGKRIDFSFGKPLQNGDYIVLPIE